MKDKELKLEEIEASIDYLYDNLMQKPFQEKKNIYFSLILFSERKNP